MKKSFLAITLFIAAVGFSQDVKTVKKTYDAKEYDKAQIAVDAFVAKDEKKAEAWFWKHKVYYAISQSEQFSKLVPNALKTGWDALMKYSTIDPKLDLAIRDNILGYMENFNNYYNKFVGKASANLDAKNYKESVVEFKNALIVSKYYYDKKITTNALDTNITFYTGYAAMKGELNEDAEIYLKKIADANIATVDAKIAFQWLSHYYIYDKKDAKKGQEYAEKGLKIYAEDEYLLSQKSEAIASGGDYNAIFANHEADINKPTSAFMDYLKYGIDLFTYLYNDTTKKPDFTEKQSKFDMVMGKALSLKPNNAESNYLMGFHLSNKAVLLQNKLKEFKNKKAPADLAAKKKVEEERLALVDASIKNLDLACSIYRGKGANIKDNEKDNYKATLSNLIVLYKFKNNLPRVKSFEEELKELK
jgi:hypothetical protein